MTFRRGQTHTKLQGSPEDQSLEGITLPLRPQEPHLGKKQCRGEGGRGQSGTERREAGGRGLRTGESKPTHHHLLPLAFRGKVLVVGSGWAGGGGQTLSSRERWQ